MATDHAAALWQLLAAGIAPPSKAPAWRWCEDHFELDQSSRMKFSKYSTDFTPFVRLIFGASQNPETRQVHAMIAAQFFKSQFLICFFGWILENQPGQLMWIMANAEMCEDFIEIRLKRALKNCRVLAPKLAGMTRSMDRKDLIQFPSMDVIVLGSNSLAKLQSWAIQYLVCDERADWKPGAIEAARNRLASFDNRLEISAGTAGTEGDRWHLDFLDGSQTICHFNCLKCGHSQPWRFGREPTSIFKEPRAKGGVTWEKAERTKPGKDGWENAVMETVVFECESCGHHHRPEDKKEMVKTIHGKDYNPGADHRIKSFQSSVLPCLWDTAHWGRVAIKFLKATEELAFGNKEPLKDFVTKVLCEPWRESMAQPDLTDTFDLIREPYGWNEVWPAEVTRFMGVDCQAKGGDHFWWAIRSISSTGQRRLVAYGKALTFEQLEEVRKSYGVPVTNAVIDHGYKGATVARFCAATGWKPMKGEEDAHFTARVNGKAVRRYWQATKINPQLGQKASGPRREVTLYRWSNPSFKDLLNNCLTGLTPGFSVPLEPGKDWLSHMSAEQRVEEKNSRGELVSRWKEIRDDDHLRDCELMILAAMHIAAHFGKCPHPMGGVMRQPGPN